MLFGEFRITGGNRAPGAHFHSNVIGSLNIRDPAPQINRAFLTDHTAFAHWPNKAQGQILLLHSSQRRTSARIVFLMPHRDNLQNRRRILKSGDSWPLVLVRRRPSRALHPGMAVCTRAFGHDVLVGRFCASSNSRRRSARANSPLVFGDSRISHSEPSVCATLALLVGRVLRRRTPRVPRGFAGPQLELWAVCGDPDTTTGTIWLGFTSASRVTAPCVFHRHSERRHAGGAISG